MLCIMFNKLLMIIIVEKVTSNHFGGSTPFKVQVNINIPSFEFQIDVDALAKWLNMLMVTSLFKFFPLAKI